MVRSTCAFAFAVLMPLAAAADVVRPESVIRSVTVFPAGAEVARSVAVEVPAGATTVVVAGLPAELEAESLGVSGTADAAVEIGSVETRVVAADAVDDPERRAVLDRIRALEDRRAGVEDRLAALNGRRRFVEALAGTLPEGFGEAVAAGNDAGAWTAASARIGEELAAVGDAARSLRREARDIEEEIAAERKRLAALPPPRDRLEAHVGLAAAAPAEVTLTVVYRVPSARWTPAYDAHLATGRDGGPPRVMVVRRAEVSQATGEDWRDVALVLSTARPAAGTAVPELRPPVVGRDRRDRDLLRSSEALHAPPLAALPVPAEDAARAVTVATASPDLGDFHAEYRVPGAVSVASGAGARTVRLAVDEAGVDLEVRAAPAAATAAYLHARFTLNPEAPLLPGPVALFRDGAFVGSGMFAFATAGAEIDLGFGVDDRVEVVREAVDRMSGSAGLLSSRRTDARSFRITVENRHDGPFRITVLDTVPVSEDEEVVVERLPGSTPPTAEDVDGRRGLVAWTYEYGPGESRSIVNGYRVSWPADDDPVVLGD